MCNDNMCQKKNGPAIEALAKISLIFVNLLSYLHAHLQKEEVT